MIFRCRPATPTGVIAPNMASGTDLSSVHKPDRAPHPPPRSRTERGAP